MNLLGTILVYVAVAEVHTGGFQSTASTGILAAIDFLVEDAAKSETLLTTETRVYAMDA
jgi:hypothetical protein